MQKIIIEKPYQYVPPDRGTIWSTIIKFFDLQGRYLRKSEGVFDHEIRHIERLQESLRAGHGILLTPNHSRNADPLLMGWLSKAAPCHVFGMASWHLFNQGWFTAWAIRKMGGFSINREGVDRQAINESIGILENAERPLIIFPEGAVTRMNDRLHALLDGVAFIARTAAKRREKKVEGGKVVVHPIAIKYRFEGDLEKQAGEVLREIEQRLTWKPQSTPNLLHRIDRIGDALLCLKELEYFGEPQVGKLDNRLDSLINRLLHPIEEDWLGKTQSGPVVPRIKACRMKMLPDMVNGRVEQSERERRWHQLADLYLAQQVSCYHADYLTEMPSIDRILETVERFEEDLTDKVRVHGHLKAIIHIGEAIEVSTKRDRNVEVDPLMAQIRDTLQSQLDELAKESPLYRPEA
ncbi:MAG: 1-acyl-sn-glycerol-3-phosphate acyltransferase [Pirellulaceae bacterium]|jgi:1-acyl-sn-glycerol-3-phosphate acyltransferase